MDRLDTMRSFTAVVDLGSFSAAADRRGLPRSTVSKHIRALETDLGVQLLNRTTRRVAPTDAGRAYAERCRAILADIDEADRSVAAVVDTPRGELRLNAPLSFGILHLGPALAEFSAGAPEVEIDLSLGDRLVDPIEEGFDLVIRIAELEDSSLIARTLCAARRVLCAAPAYLEARGTPGAPEDLARHSCLLYGAGAAARRWRLFGTDRDHTVEVDGPMRANNGDVLREAAIGGLGIALLPTFIVGDALKRGDLVTVLDDTPPSALPVSAVYPPNRHLSAKVRALIDFLADRYRGTPPWDR